MLRFAAIRRGNSGCRITGRGVRCPRSVAAVTHGQPGGVLSGEMFHQIFSVSLRTSVNCEKNSLAKTRMTV